MPIIGFGGGFGGGGGGASYINGVVPTSADLPITVGNPAMDSVYLAKVGSGVWLINRKPAGLYCRTANNGVAADWTYLGAFPEVNADGNWELYNTADPTKELKFSLSGISTGTTRTLTVPNASGRIQVEGQPIGNTTPAAGTFTTLSANNGTLTASAPVLDLSQTWNNAAVTFTGIRANITDTASAAASNLLDLQSGGTSAMRVDRTGRVIIAAGGASGNGNGAIAIGSGGGGFYQRTAGGLTFTGGSFELSPTGVTIVGQLRFGINMSSTDSTLVREAANELALRGSTTTNPQTFRIYNTFTDASNYERGFMRWSSNVLQIGTEVAGTGTSRDISIIGNTTFSNNVTISGGRVLSANQINLNATSTALLALGADSTIRWGASSATAPLLKRSSTALQVRLADDSAFAPFACAGLTLNGDLTASTRNIVTDTTTGTKIGTATTQLLGFWNATPVAQQSSTGTNATGFTANGPGNTVHADSTFTGNVGATAYTISDIVKHLKTIGLIAS